MVQKKKSLRKAELRRLQIETAPSSYTPEWRKSGFISIAALFRRPDCQIVAIFKWALCHYSTYGTHKHTHILPVSFQEQQAVYTRDVQICFRWKQ